MTIVDEIAHGRPRRAVRAMLLVPFLFYVSPLVALARSGEQPWRMVVVLAAMSGFVGLHLSLLPRLSTGPFTSSDRRRTLVLLTIMFTLATAVIVGDRFDWITTYYFLNMIAAFALPTSVAVCVQGAVVLAAFTVALIADRSPLYAFNVALGLCVWTGLFLGLGLAQRVTVLHRRAQEDRSRAAVAEERLRISRDLHDLLGHTLSVIALRSELASRLAPTDADGAGTEMAEVSTIARSALGEVRQAVSGYRESGLVDEVIRATSVLSTAGIEVHEQIAAPNDKTVDSLLAWAVREGTTNVLRHSGARSCWITTVDQGDHLRLTIEDDGRGPSSQDPQGNGLQGLAERFAIAGGVLDAGEREGGGFRLGATIPRAAKVAT